MAEYRREVGEAVAANLDEFESAGNQSEERDTARFVALIELGVRLGLEAAAELQAAVDLEKHDARYAQVHGDSDVELTREELGDLGTCYGGVDVDRELWLARRQRDALLALAPRLLAAIEKALGSWRGAPN